MKTKLLNKKKYYIAFLVVFVLLISAVVSGRSSQKQDKNDNHLITLTARDGSQIVLVDTADVDGDGIENALELNGFTYNVIDGLQPWNGDTTVTYYKTDPLRWSTDGDPYSDYMEVTGINMPSAVKYPENNPLVAARPIITIKMVDYDVIPLETITNSQGGEQSSSFTNTTSNSNTVSASVTVEASLNPFKLASASVTAGYSHTWTSTQSTTSSLGSNWSNTRTINPDQAARLRLRIYMENDGSATALNVEPTINLKLGHKTIATFIPGQTANILTPPGTTNSRFPQNGTIVIEKDKDNNDIVITLDDLKAIQAGTPLSIEVVQVSAQVVRWNPVDQDWNSDIDWAGFESDIDPVSVEVLADLGNGESYRYQVFAGSQYWDPKFTFKDIASLIFNVKKKGSQYSIDDRDYPGKWYLSTPSEAIINAWTEAGEPQSMLDVVISKNTKLVMMSPGTTPDSKINLAIYSGDFSHVIVSAQPNNFPILNVKAEVPLASGTKTVTLQEGDNSFFTNDTLLDGLPIGPGTVYVTNARGDVSTATIQIPSYYRNAQEVKEFSSFLPNPGAEYWIFPNGDENRPMALYCLFFDPVSGSELEIPRTYLSIQSAALANNFSEQSYGGGYGRATFTKLQINPLTLKLALNDQTFMTVNSRSGEIIDSDFKPGNIYFNYPAMDSLSASLDLSGTPYSFDPAVKASYVLDTKLHAAMDNKRQKFTINKSGLLNLSSQCCTYKGLGDDSLQLVYNYPGIQYKEPPKTGNMALDFNRIIDDGHVNAGDSDTLRFLGDLTMEAWIYPTGNSNSIYGGIILNEEGQYEVARFQDGNIYWAIDNPQGWVWNNTFYAAPEKAWSHIAIAADGSTIKTYINGELFSVIPGGGIDGDAVELQNEFWIAGRQSISQPFQGLIDDVRVWNVARTAEQIKSTYLTELPEQYYSTADSGLVGYWNFDHITAINDSTNIVKDLSIYGNDGQLFGDIVASEILTELSISAPKLPEKYALNQNYPNPFNPVTTITYGLKKSAEVKLVVYNMVGQKVKTLVSGYQSAGTKTLQWDGLNENNQQVASGTYIYAMFINGQLVKSRKMALIR